MDSLWALHRLGYRGRLLAKSKAEEYHAKARECEKLAQAASDQFIRQQLLEIAEKWRTMAAFEEKFVR